MYKSAEVTEHDALIEIDGNPLDTGRNHVRLTVKAEMHWPQRDWLYCYEIGITTEQRVSIPDEGIIAIRLLDGREHRQSFVKLHEIALMEATSYCH